MYDVYVRIDFVDWSIGKHTQIGNEIEEEENPGKILVQVSDMLRSGELTLGCRQQRQKPPVEIVKPVIWHRRRVSKLRRSKRKPQKGIRDGTIGYSRPGI